MTYDVIYTLIYTLINGFIYNVMLPVWATVISLTEGISIWL